MDLLSTFRLKRSWIRKDGGLDGRGAGFYFRNTTEIILFGVRGQMRTPAPMTAGTLAIAPGPIISPGGNFGQQLGSLHTAFGSTVEALQLL